MKPAQAILEQATAARLEQGRSLADARGVAQAAKLAADRRKAELDASIAARAAAEKVLADRRPAVDVLVARANDAREEVEFLIAEQKAAAVAKTATANNAP